MVSFFGDIKGPLSDMFWETTPDTAFAEMRNRRLTEVSVFVSGVQNLVEINDISLAVRPTINAAHQNIIVNEALTQHAGEVLTDQAQTQPQQQPVPRPAENSSLTAQTEAKIYQFPTRPEAAAAPVNQTDAMMYTFPQQPTAPAPTHMGQEGVVHENAELLNHSRQQVSEALAQHNPLFSDQNIPDSDAHSNLAA